MADQELYSDARRFDECMTEYAALSKKVPALEQEWLELTETLEEAIRQLKENETVTQIYRVTGRDRLHVHAVASSQEELESFLANVIDRLPGVVECSCGLILSRVKDVKGLRL